MRDLYAISNELCNEYREYFKTLDKYNCNTAELAKLQYEIETGAKKLVCIEKSYYRTNSGRFSSVPYESKEKEINVRFYLNIISSIPIFKDRVKKAYTKYGYIPVMLTCFCWGDRGEKKVREFKIVNL